MKTLERSSRKRVARALDVLFVLNALLYLFTGLICLWSPHFLDMFLMHQEKGPLTFVFVYYSVEIICLFIFLDML